MDIGKQTILEFIDSGRGDLAIMNKGLVDIDLLNTEFIGWLDEDDIRKQRNIKIYNGIKDGTLGRTWLLNRVREESATDDAFVRIEYDDFWYYLAKAMKICVDNREDIIDINELFDYIDDNNKKIICTFTNDDGIPEQRLVEQIEWSRNNNKNEAINETVGSYNEELAEDIDRASSYMLSYLLSNQHRAKDYKTKKRQLSRIVKKARKAMMRYSAHKSIVLDGDGSRFSDYRYHIPEELASYLKTHRL